MTPSPKRRRYTQQWMKDRLETSDILVERAIGVLHLRGLLRMEDGSFIKSMGRLVVESRGPLGARLSPAQRDVTRQILRHRRELLRALTHIANHPRTPRT